MASSRMRMALGALAVVLCALVLATAVEANYNTQRSVEQIMKGNEDMARNMMPKWFKRGNPRAKEFKEALKFFETTMPKKWRGQLQVCECAIKKFEEKTVMWLNVGKAKKCRTGVFRLQKIVDRNLDGEFSLGNLHDYEASSIDIDVSDAGVAAQDAAREADEARARARRGEL